MRLLRNGLVLVFLAATASSLSAQKMMVNILSWKQNQHTFARYATGDSAAPGTDFFHSRQMSLPDLPVDHSHAGLYIVHGASYRLLRPDGQIAVVSCTVKADHGSLEQPWRDCRMPQPSISGNLPITAGFKGNKVKLTWQQNGRRKPKLLSETYDLVSISGSNP